ncbi:MAG: hypothetical protein IAF08_03120 [Rhizobacter sp.]|nr:hypothetical protein [Chlorobiales bacterium]
MPDLIDVFAERSKLNRDQSEKVLAGTFIFIKVQVGADNYQKVLDEIPEVASLSNVFMNGGDAKPQGGQSGLGGQFGEMMKMMAILQKADVSQDLLQKLTPLAFAVIGERLSEETKTLVAARMPMFKGVLEGKKDQKLPGVDSLLKPLFGKK